MSGNKILKRIFLLTAALACTGAVLFGWHSFFLPGWIVWESGVYQEGADKYEIILDRKTVQIKYEGAIIWDSPEGMKVQDVLSCDIDGDGEDELILLCWKKGRYGRYKPFWIEKDEKTWSQHIFVYEYVEDEIRPKWMSSYIGTDVAKISEGRGAASASRLWLTDPKGNVSSWKWDSWGFTKEETEVSVVAFGDNLIHEPIYRYGLQNGGSFDFLFENFEDIIKKSDIAVINQETPFVEDPAMYGDYPRFGTPVNVGYAIADAGFDVVTCATNHALDRGTEGVETTRELFDSRGIKCLGIQTEDEPDYEPYQVIVRNNIRFGLLNYTYGTNGIRMPDTNPDMVHLLADEDRVREDIEKAGEETDIVIVFVHWGTENSQQIDEFQEKWTQVFLESKVDVVIGTHPHALQPCEILESESGHKMLIYYSIGNFVSAQPEKSCVKGGMAEFTVSLTAEGYQVTEYMLQPLVIEWHEGGKYIASVLSTE